MNLKKICKEKNIKIKDLSNLTGLSESTIYSITSGRRNPSMSTLIKLKEALNVDFDIILKNA